MDTLHSVLRGDGPELCDGCSIKFSMFRRRRVCVFCKFSFCGRCAYKRPDKNFTCVKCQILTSRPLNKTKLYELKNKDLVNYLTKKHISTSGCVEKEDLINVLVRAVDNSSYHPGSNNHSSSPGSSQSIPNTPKISLGASEARSRHLCSSTSNISDIDSIRVEPLDSGSTRLSVESRTSSSSEEEDEDFEIVYNTDEAATVEVEPNTIETADCDDNDRIKNLPLHTIALSDILCDADLQALSVKQLKALLMKNRTNYSGCVERAELCDKVKLLWMEYITSRNELANLSSNDLCKICMDAPIECVLLECGHAASCTACGKQLSECPICRQYIVRCVRFFKA